MNECEKKSEYTEKNLNLTTKISLLYRNLSQVQREKKSELESGHLNFTKFHEKNLNDSDKSESMAGLLESGMWDILDPRKISKSMTCLTFLAYLAAIKYKFK